MVTTQRDGKKATATLRDEREIRIVEQQDRTVLNIKLLWLLLGRCILLLLNIQLCVPHIYKRTVLYLRYLFSLLLLSSSPTWYSLYQGNNLRPKIAAVRPARYNTLN
jgi:hypothetical protein